MLLHRVLVLEAVSSFSNVVPIFRRKLATTWRVFLTASDAEIVAEVMWALKRKLSIASSVENHDISFYETMLTTDPARFVSSFRSALTENELARLHHYEKTVGDQHVHMLNQNPMPPSSHGQSSSPTILHTIISNAGIQWISERGRWVTPSEFLIANGIPTTYHLGNVTSPAGGRCSSFCSGGTHERSNRKRSNVAYQAGNTMNVSVTGIFWLYCLCWVQLREGDDASGPMVPHHSSPVFFEPRAA